MQIRKVKSANGLILIRAEEASGEEDIRRIELESRAEPRWEFHEAMGGMIAPALDMIQAPEAWRAAATISGVSITHEEEPPNGGGMGAVVTLRVPLECAPSPLIINTPYLTSGATEDHSGRGAPILPTALCNAVIRVIDEALRYLRGDRAQGDLFAERPDDPFDGEMIYRALTKHDADGVVEVGSEADTTIKYALPKTAAEKILENVQATRAAVQSGDSLTVHGEAQPAAEPEPAHIVAGKLVEGSADLAEAMNEQSVAEPEPLSDGRPPHEVRAEFERIRAEAMHRQPVIKPARGRRPVKADLG